MTPEIRRRRLNNLGALMVFATLLAVVGMMLYSTQVVTAAVYVALLANFMQQRVLHAPSLPPGP